MVEGAARPAKNPAWFKSSQPCAPRGMHFGVCRVVSVMVLRSSPVACAVTWVWVPARWESSIRERGFPAQGTSLPPSAGSLLLKFGRTP